MDLREIIQKARENAKSPDEALLSERFEEYLDLLELRTQVTQKESVELQSRLMKSLASLKEVADRVADSYGVEPEKLVHFFMSQANIGMPKMGQEKNDGQSASSGKRMNKKIRV